ncbi:MAG: PBP1A family penicillin-binding protein [Deltaproteobacteria bacterium]|nr:PBP1A family penicillin-binding protein [Deltaproteobacteria bacterium]
MELEDPQSKNILFWIIYPIYLTPILIILFLIYLSFDLPTLEHLESPKYDLPTQVYDINDQLVTEFYTKRRVLIPFEKVPQIMIDALLAIEDSRFYYHFGIDPIRMIKAFIIDLIKMDFAQGASTLTQQTAKMFLLSSEKKIIRKIKEILLAIEIESRFTKKEILELYLNKTYFGHGAYGVEAAAQSYFNKNTEDLNLNEVAVLAGLPQAPSRWAPTKSLVNATRRRNIVLKAMADNGFISQETRETISKSPIILNLNQNLDNNETSYYTEHIRKYVLENYGMDLLYKGGMKVYSTMDLKQQINAQQALIKGLNDLNHRQGYRGPIKNVWKEVDHELNLNIYSRENGLDRVLYRDLDPQVRQEAQELFEERQKIETANNHYVIGDRLIGVVTKVSPDLAQVYLGDNEGALLLDTMRWARPVDYEEELNWKTRLRNINDILKQGDVVQLEIIDYDQASREFTLALYQKPIANGGIFVMDPQTGHVLAMSGGYDFNESEFNRATQSKRQPGSSFKPIVYSLALDNGFTRVTKLDDTPLVFKDTEWRPSNFTKQYKGSVSFRDALVHSKNVPTIRLTMTLGRQEIITHAKKLGIDSELPDDLTLGLGTASVTLEEMIKAYSVFANGGNRVEPLFIKRIEDKNGNILEEYFDGIGDEVMSPETAFLMTSILKDVVNFGSGWRAKEIGRPAGGKTGTTNDFTDAWFIGYIPQIIAGVYVGFDNTQQSLGNLETGSKAAAPIWTNFMKATVADLPIMPFAQPDEIKVVRVNPETGLLDCQLQGDSRIEYFKSGTEPIQCHQASGAQLKTAEPDGSKKSQGILEEL